MKAAIYARVSTDKEDQEKSLNSQLLSLEGRARDLGYSKIYKIYDTLSGGKVTREGYQTLLKLISQRKIDLIIATRLDRLSRSVEDLIGFVTLCREKNIEVLCTEQNFDTTTPEGKLIFYVFAALAEFQRDIQSRIVKDGIIRMKEEGLYHNGKPSYNLTAEQEQYLINLRNKRPPVSFRKIVKKFKKEYGFDISLGYVHKICKIDKKDSGTNDKLEVVDLMAVNQGSYEQAGGQA